MSDFKVITINTTIANASASKVLTEGTDYTLESGVTAEDCLCFISSPRCTPGGSTGGGTQNLDDFTAWISNPSNIETSLSILRSGNSNACRFVLTIVQYTGRAGGANEFKVRDEGLLIPGLTATSVSTSTITNIVDSDKVAVWITGQGSFTANFVDWDWALFTADLVADGDDWVATFTRGSAPSPSAVTRISYQVVEFTGSNWRDVQRLAWTAEASAWDTTTSDVSATVSLATALLDVDKAFMHCQYMVSGGEEGLDDCGDSVVIASTTTLRYRNRATSGTRTKVAWIIENTQSGLGEMNVQHEEWYDSDVTGPEEKTYTRTITAVDSILRAFCTGMTCSVDGSGTAYPRGSASVMLSSTTVVDWIVSDTGQEEWRALSIVELPDENLLAAPSPASAGTSTVDPTVELGSVSVTPDEVTAFTATVDPTAFQASLTVSPAQATAATATVDPAVELGSVSVTPSPAAAFPATVAPTIELGSVSVSPAQATAFPATADPTTVQASLAVAPVAAAAFPATVDPAVELASVVVSPSPAAGFPATVAPTIELGSVSVTPAPVAAVPATVDPTPVLGSVSVSPAQATAFPATVDPTTFQASLAVAPAEASGFPATVDPTVSLTGGGETATPAPAEASPATPAGDVVLGSVSVAPSPAEAFSASQDPLASLGSLTLSAAASATTATQAPVVELGGLLVTPAPAAGFPATVAPTVQVITDPGLVTPAPAEARASTAIGLVRTRQVLAGVSLVNRTSSAENAVARTQNRDALVNRTSSATVKLRK